MSNIGDFVNSLASGEGLRSEFDMFEPWDVKERGESILAHMRRDEVTEKVAEYGDAPHLFQSGIIFDQRRVVAIFAGTQVGKSYPVQIDMLIQCTGRIPHSLRYPKGFQTNIRREVSRMNIRRWGRHHIDTGEFIDHDEEREEDGTWDCGCIIGAGIYPKEKIMRPDGSPSTSVIWVGTFKQAADENWFRKLKQMIPETSLNKSRGVNGFSQRDKTVYFSNGAEIHIITYEKGYERFESVKVFRCVLDEEPPNEKIFSSALGHCYQLTLVETPYRGITYTYHRIKKQALKDPMYGYYHCIQYDCPYKTPEEIRIERAPIPKWEIDARVYGLHSEQCGKPYWHDMYNDLTRWVKNFVDTGIRYTLSFSAKMVTPADAGTARPMAIPRSDGEWCVFETPEEKYSYWISCDTARGDDAEDERVDANVAHVFRLPDEKKGESLEMPVEVAYCRTQKDTKVFARYVLAGCSWYNNALMAPEAMGFSAGTFIASVHGWPFMYTMVLTDDRTRKQTERLGFNTNTKTRQTLFDEIGDMIKDHMDGECPFKSFHTANEAQLLVCGKGGRPDHPKDGSTDALMSYGIGLYVYKFDRMKIRNNRLYRSGNNNMVDKWGGRLVQRDKRDTRPVLGSKRGLDGRR